jgi:hypothetical protein
LLSGNGPRTQRSKAIGIDKEEEEEEEEEEEIFDTNSIPVILKQFEIFDTNSVPVILKHFDFDNYKKYTRRSS